MDNEETTTAIATTAPDIESIIQSMMPFGADSNKVRFIGYRASGFTISESIKLTGIHGKTLHRWRESDPSFVEKESMIPQLRKQLGVEYANLEFLRNYRLILQKDFDVIVKSVRTPDKLTDGDLKYLLKARSHYTPQQLEILRSMVSDNGKEQKAFDFTQFVLTLEREKTRESITIEGRPNAISED